MAVKTVTANTAERQLIQDLLCKHEIEVWLPNGMALDAGDGCFTSPHLHFSPLTSHQAAPLAKPDNLHGH